MNRKDIIFVLILIVILFGIYWKTFNYELVWDSRIYLKNNFLITENYPISSAFKFGYLREQLGAGKIDFYYRPLLTASFLIENKLWGLGNVTLRLTNLLIYILSLIFLFIFFKLQSDKKYFPEIATLLFALYPLNVDNIVWVLGRNDLFLLLWGSLTFLFLELFMKKKKFYLLICSSLFYLLGIFSKEAFLFFLPLLIIYEIIKRKKITIPYHFANIIATLIFFILKNKILGIKNLRFILSSSFTENVVSAIAALGYYFKSIIFPFDFDKFLSINEATNYLYLGIISILVIFYLLFLSKKDKELLIPLFFILVFLGGHVLLVFTFVFPFKLYARYMMIPALAFIWIFSKYISPIKEKIRLIIVFILLLLFIPSIIINASSYETELKFFQKAHKASPGNTYLLFQVANVLYERNNFMAAELFLNRSLQLSLRRGTAMLVSLLYADIELRKADYENVLKWIKSIEEFETLPNIQLGPYIKLKVNHKKAQVHIKQGNVDAAQKILKEAIREYKNFKRLYTELYFMYIGQNMWEEAKDIEKIMKARFSTLRSINTEQIRKKFDSLPAEGKIGFYISYNNFYKAVSFVQNMSSLDVNHQILLAKLYYWLGKEKKAEEKINEILLENPDDYNILNAIGFMYLRDLIRAKEALFYFQKSLKLNESQPEIAQLIDYIENEYLSKLKPVWPDKSQQNSL